MRKPKKKVSIYSTDSGEEGNRRGSFLPGVTRQPTMDKIKEEDNSPPSQKMSSFRIPKISDKMKSFREPKILIIDDEPFNIIALTSLIGKLKYKSESEYSAEKAVSRLKDSYSPG